MGEYDDTYTYTGLSLKIANDVPVKILIKTISFYTVYQRRHLSIELLL